MRLKFFDRFTSGLLVGVVSALILAMMIDSDVSNFAKERWLQFATIIAALVAALIALYGVYRQIDHQNELSERNRKRELAAYRATLPLVLSEMITIAKNGMDASLSLNGLNNASQSTINAAIHLDREYLETIRQCIKVSDPISQNWLSKIVASYQVYKSRSSKLASLDLPTQANPLINAPYERLSLALDWATFHMLVEHAFKYARGHEDQIPQLVVATKINTAFFLNDIDTDGYLTFQNLVEVRVARLGMATSEDFLKR